MDISTLKIGDQTRATSDIDLKPYTVVRAGEVGTVVAIHPDGEVNIRLDSHHCGLDIYHNEIWIFPDCDDVAEYLEKVEPADVV
jgi:hypothetical protein